MNERVRVRQAGVRQYSRYIVEDRHSDVCQSEGEREREAVLLFIVSLDHPIQEDT